MTILDKLKTPIVQRTIYLNVLYGLMVLLSTLVVSVLVANEDVSGEKFPRYQVCKFGDNSTVLSESPDGQCRAFAGATYDVDADPSFQPATADEELATTQQTTYEIAAAAVGINVVLLVHTLLQHAWKNGCSEMLVKLHQMGGVVISLVNIGLFAGLVGNIYSVTGVDNDDNIKYNVYFKDINIAAVSIIGLVGGVVDLAFQLYLNIPHLKDICVGSITDNNAACWL